MKKIIFIIVIAGVLGGSCGKGFLSSLQNNPNQPSGAAATPQLILPGTITGLVGILNGTGTSSAYEAEGVWEGYWNYAGGYTFISNVQNTVITSGDPQLWDNYFGVLTNLNVIVQLTSKNPTMGNYFGIANIMEAICFQNLVDLYGDIPYTHALQGAGDFFPSYDHGSDIYDSLVIKLDTAIGRIQANLSNVNATLPTADDPLFHGNMNAWLLFANTVKLRLLVRESNVSAKQALITSEIGNTASVGYLGLGQDALVNPGYSGAKPSPMYGNFGLAPSGSVNGGYAYLRAGGYALNFYKKTNDPRIGYFYSFIGLLPNSPTYYNITIPEVSADYYADLFGLQQTATGLSSGIGPGLVKNPSQSAVMMSASESLFLQAEAVVRGYMTGNAQTLYQQAIQASFEYLGVGSNPSGATDNSIADGYAQTYYNQNLSYVAFPAGATSDSLIHTILTQKWAALNGISNAEAYNDWRRTYDPTMNSGYPIVPLSLSPSNTAPHMPFRYLYPTEESNANSNAWKAAGGGTVDPFNTKVFWMP